MAQLIVENGPHKGTRLTLSRETPSWVGADPECELALPEPGIAARHFVVKALKGNGFGAKCSDSVLRINHENIEAARLDDGDVMEIGDTRIRFQANGDAAPRATSREISGFRLHEVLGAGGMGTVYRADQISLNREVALKVLSKDLTKDPVFVARFVAEARAAARLHHPNVVQVFDVGHEGDTFFYSMEVMEGSLEEQLRNSGRLDVDECLRLAADAARGLSYAESLRIVHRDIKPDNLMLDKHGNVKLADLGLAMTDEDDVSKVIGTPHFMSPEQALGKPLDHRSDLYSLGCTLYRLLTGQVPFKRGSIKEILKAHVKDTPEPVHKINSEVPAEVSAIVERLLAKSADDRYQSADELLADIEEVTAPRARKGLIVAGAALALVIAGSALAWGLTRPEGKTVTKTITASDPRVAALLEEQRQMRAELDRRAALLLDLHGEERAAALAKVAADHPDTDAATAALAEAKNVRRDLAAKVAAAAAAAKAVAAACDKLEARVTAAITAGDYRAAVSELQLSSVEPDMRREAKVKATVNRLQTALVEAADQRFAALRRQVDQAKEARDPAALERALADLEPLVDSQTGWPDQALPTRAEAAAQLVADRRFLEDLRNELDAAAVAQQWRQFDRRVLGPNGVVALAGEFRFERARAAAEAVARDLGNSAAATRAIELARSLGNAGKFLERFQEAAESGAVEFLQPGTTEPVPVIAFSVDGEQAGLTIKTGPVIRPTREVVPLGALRGDALADAFAIPGGPSPDVDRGAFLAWLAIADQLRWAREYLSTVDPARPTSATGEEGYPGTAEVLDQAQAELARGTDAWMSTLRDEITAAQQLVRALRAFSAQRNLSATNYLQGLISDSAGSLVVRALQ